MIKKYLCMTEGCDFLTEDEQVAIDHLDEGPEHEVIEVVLRDHKLFCRKLVERVEEMEMIAEEDLE